MDRKSNVHLTIKGAVPIVLAVLLCYAMYWISKHTAEFLITAAMLVASVVVIGLPVVFIVRAVRRVYRVRGYALLPPMPDVYNSRHVPQTGTVDQTETQPIATRRNVGTKSGTYRTAPLRAYPGTLASTGDRQETSHSMFPLRGNSPEDSVGGYSPDSQPT